MAANLSTTLSASISTYDTVLRTITYVDITVQLYTLVVMLRATPDRMKQYRFYMVFYTLCDLAFAVVLGVVLHPVPVGAFSCVAWRGIFQSFDRQTSRYGFCLALFVGTAVLSAQNYCIAYRMSVVFADGRYAKHFVPIKAKIASLTTILLICSSVSVVGYFLTTLDMWNPEKDELLRVALSPGSDAFACLSLNRTAIWPLGAVMLPLFAIFEVLFYACAIGTVWYIRKMSSKLSDKSRKLNGHLSLLLLLQTSSPIACIFVPCIIGVIPMLLGTYSLSAEATMFGFIMFCSFPLVNSLLTLTFVKPYRTFTVNLLLASCRKRRPVHDVAMVSWKTLQPGGNNASRPQRASFSTTST